MSCLMKLHNKFARGLINTPKQLSYFSTSTLQVTHQDNYAVVKLNSPPVNAITLQLAQELTNTVKELEKDETCRGIILSSTNPKIFCGGLDLKELHQPEPEDFTEFWTALQDLYLQLYLTPLATICAMEGHGPAGGCFLASCCDYRIMGSTGDKNTPRIGFNETKFGIVAPNWFADIFKNIVGHRDAEKLLSLGTQITAETGKEIGLIDEAVPVDKVMECAIVQIKEWLKIPDFARSTTKQLIRKETAERLSKNRGADLEYMTNILMSEGAQNSIGQYLASLSKKNK